MEPYTPISVVIITFNEEKNIVRCLNSVQSIADDILIVDSFSTDNTVELAKKIGARIVNHKFEGYIEQKNFAISQAKYPHIFSLDADELPDEMLINEIRRIKKNWIKDGYNMNRLNNYCGKWIRHGAWYPDIKLRLWDSRKGKWGGTNPHDKFIMNNEASIQHLKGNILHYSYTSILEHRNKVEYFSSIAAQAYYQKEIKSSQLKIFYKPIIRFIRDYFFKFGFLDGKCGFMIAFLIAKEVKLKYKKLLLMKNN